MNDNYKGTQTNYFMKFSILILSIMMLSMVSANVVNQDFVGGKQNQNLTVVQSCVNSTYANISSIYIDSNGNNLITSQVAMTEQSDDTYNYVITNPNQIGKYIVVGFCDEDGTKITWKLGYEITPSGFVGTLGFYLVLILLLTLLIALGFYISEEWFVILGGLGLMMLGIYSINSGIAGFRDMFMTWGVGLFEIGVGFILAIKSSFELFKD